MKQNVAQPQPNTILATAMGAHAPIDQQHGWQHWLVWSWTGFMAVGLFLAFHSYGYDDPYITYRYAFNLGHGQGFVYNKGTQVLSTTTPLYTLLLTPAAVLNLPIPLLSNAIGCVAMALGGLALYSLGRHWQAPYAAVVGLLLYPLFPLLMQTLGSELVLGNLLVLWAFVLYSRERYAGMAILLALATINRADGVLAAAVLALHFILVRRARWPWRAVACYGVVVASWFSWAWWYFGTPFPATLAAKQQQGRMALSTRFWPGFLQLLASYWQQPFYRVMAVLILIGLGYLIIRQRSWLPLIAWNVVYLAAYTLLGVTRYHWYYAPLVVGTIILTALGVEAVAQTMAHWRPPIAIGLAVAAIAPLLVAQGGALVWQYDHPDPRQGLYQAAGTWLATNTTPTATVGTLEVGILGFYSERTMIDFAGLIQPETAGQLGPTTTYEDAATWATSHFNPEYLVLRRGSLPRLTVVAQQRHCTSATSFADQAGGPPLDILHCPR